MKRIEVNCTTGDSLEIAQTLYKDSAGGLHILDTIDSPLPGYQQITNDEAAAIIEASKPAPTAEQVREAAKALRSAAVSVIIVTTSTGKTFDGDETSQTRMARAILALQAAGAASTLWVLADNTPTTVTTAELGEALALAGAAQSAIWVIA